MKLSGYVAFFSVGFAAAVDGLVLVTGDATGLTTGFAGTAGLAAATLTYG